MYFGPLQSILRFQSRLKIYSRMYEIQLCVNAKDELGKLRPPEKEFLTPSLLLYVKGTPPPFLKSKKFYFLIFKIL